MGCSCSLAKTDHRRFSRSASLDINSSLLHQLFHCDRTTSFLGIRRILVFFVGHSALDYRFLRTAQADVIVCFWTRTYTRHLDLANGRQSEPVSGQPDRGLCRY